ncbi:hypothetical protein K9692_003713 [Escherichia coli]|nr:hypothetical protein [Escherichia coli]
MKVTRLVSLASTIAVAMVITGCSSNSGKTPDTSMSMYKHGVYWHQNPGDSVAKNAFSLSGFTVNFEEQTVKPGSDADNFLSKVLVSGSMGYITGGLTGLSIMSLGSLYSESDAERIQVNQFIVFVPNPSNLPYDDDSLVKAGGKYTLNYVSDGAKKWGFDSKKAAIAVDQCTIDKAVINKWSKCVLPSKPAKDVAPTESLFSFQAVRPATGKELPELGLPAGNYSVIRYTSIPSGFVESSKDFNGIIFRPDNKNTVPGGLAASIKGNDYYLFSGEFGKKAFPEKTEAPGAKYKLR